MPSTNSWIPARPLAVHRRDELALLGEERRVAAEVLLVQALAVAHEQPVDRLAVLEALHAGSELGQVGHLSPPVGGAVEAVGDLRHA